MSERMKELKKETRFMRTLLNILVLSALIVCSVPAKAQNFTSSNQPQQEWKTSTLQTSGSAYSSQVTEVGATTAAYQATTTMDSYNSNGFTGPRKGFGTNQEGGETGDESSPIGDAVLPLLLLAMVYSAMRYFRNKHVKSLNC